MTDAIKSTMNYGMFELHQFNREVIKTKKLEESMKKHGWINAYPMHVVRNGGGKLKIKAGHHRYAAAIKLGIPVKYVICKEDHGVSIQELEGSTTPWSIKDYLDSYCKLGLKPYLKVRGYHEQSGIPLHVCISLVGGDSAGSGGNFTKKFKSGTYESGDISLANDVKNIVLSLKAMGCDFAAKKLFLEAISKVLRLKQFVPSTFLKRCEVNLGSMQPQQNQAAYLDLIETIYNYHAGRKNRLPLAFMANEEADRRNAVRKSQAA